MKRGLLLLLVVIVVLTFIIIQNNDSSDSTSSTVSLPSFVFVTIDTLRADRVGSYGYPRDVTPFFDSLAESGVVFENAFSASSHTAPSHTTMFTGVYPFEHNVLRNHEVLNPDRFNIAKLFSELGYNTAGLPSVTFMDGKVGFPLIDFPTTDKEQRQLERHRFRNAADMVDRAISWLSNQDHSKPTFLWLHFYDVHQWKGRGLLPEKYYKQVLEMHRDDYLDFLESEHNTPLDFFGSREQMLEYMNNYDARLLFVDAQIRRLYDHMQDAGINKNAFWIIASDHGEGLGNHNYEGHGEFLYQEQIHIPLVFHHTAGRLEQRRVNQLIRTVDFFPTLADLAGEPLTLRDLELHGISFRSLLERGEWSGDGVQFSFGQRRPKDTVSFRKDWLNGEVMSLHDLKVKYIYRSDAEDEFYDLERDPFELENIAGTGRVEERFLTNQLKELVVPSDPEAAAVDNEPELSSDEIEELKTLGYL